MDITHTHIAAAGSVAALLGSQAIAANTNGPWTRIRNAQGTAVAILNAGAATAGTTPTLNVKLQEADDSSGTNSADIPGATFAQVTTAALCAALPFIPKSRKGYIRAVATIGGTVSPSFPVGVSLLMLPG